MLSSTRLALLASLLTVVHGYKPCPLLGPVFDQPHSLCEADTFQAALRNLTATLNYAGQSGQTPYGAFPNNITSFSVSIFDANLTLFSSQYSSPYLQNGTEGVKHVSEDSVYRVGSVSKLITAYLFLIEAGPKYWNHPITEFVPGLEDAAHNCSASLDAVDCIDWNEVTLGALASHMAGMPRDYSTPLEILFDAPLSTYVAGGLPPVPASAFPTCGYNFTNACNESEFISSFSARAPIYAPFQSPVYSNGAYELLGYALENITGRRTPDMAQADLFNKLGMTHSSYKVPTNLSNAVMPGGPIDSYFVADLGNKTPMGGYYSTQADLIRMGQSIMNAELLSPNTIRQWMKPVTFTSNMRMGVGMPWEIWRVSEMTDHVVDVYSKSGDIFSYSALFVLIPDFNVGFVVLAAGDQTTLTVELLSDIVAATIIPALEDTARAQAQQTFAGIYKSNDSSVASNITLATQPGESGLVVKSWYSNGTNILDTLAGGVYNTAAGIDARLYPAGLVQRLTPDKQRIAYRAVYRPLSTEFDGGILSADCETWVMQDTYTYGNVGLDEFVFEIEDGKATAINPRALRATLQKAS